MFHKLFSESEAEEAFVSKLEKELECWTDDDKEVKTHQVCMLCPFQYSYSIEWSTRMYCVDCEEYSRVSCNSLYIRRNLTIFFIFLSSSFNSGVLEYGEDVSDQRMVDGCHSHYILHWSFNRSSSHSSLQSSISETRRGWWYIQGRSTTRVELFYPFFPSSKLFVDLCNLS